MLSSAVSQLVAAYASVKPITYLGVLGLALAFGCAVVAALHGMTIAPEGDLTKAISFDAAVGIYLLTIALFVPLAGFTPAGRRKWLGWTTGVIIYAFGVETIQILRGLDPRFSRVAGPADQLAGILFFVAALGVIVLFAILAMKLLRRKAEGAEGLLLLGIRYAAAATAIAFAAGLWMSAMQGRKFGAQGNILPLHALGFHALQATPLVAWLLGRSGLASEVARKWIHIAGVAWIAACIMVAGQTAIGRPVTEPSPAIVLAAAALLVWTVTFLRAARACGAGNPARSRLSAGI
ncbi:MAG: hypothetical protein LAP38_04140 [Acidobacteriia bacterium]|nr:hypothetical protein [Terriglobia bacterium]